MGKAAENSMNHGLDGLQDSTEVGKKSKPSQKSVMQTKKEQQSVPEGYKQTAVGVIPEEWEIKRLKEILTEARLGGNYENEESNHGVPIIKMGNIGRGTIKLDKIQNLPENAVYDDEDILNYGDLLFNTRNTLELVGKVAIWKNELPFALYNSNILRMKFDETSVKSNFFMNYVFNSYYTLSRLKGVAT